MDAEDLDRDGKAPEDDDDFASLFEESLVPTALNEGDTVEGRIVSIGRDVAFVDVGGKGEATIDLDELVDEDGDLDVQPGDVVQAVVVSTKGGLTLSHKLARGAATRERIHQAHRAGLPVEGRVERSINGGFEVRVAGMRAFCPISQIDTAYTEDPSVHEGRVYNFRIIRFEGDGRNQNLVVSRRALIEEEEREEAESIRKTIVPGADLPGRVASLQSYGAFIDLGGGIQGLLHVSEMGWSRVDDPSSILQPGQELTVKVLRVDAEKGKISLGIKQLGADPWDGAADTYEVGQVLRGRVTRLAEFGAFVELEPGIEALAHVSEFPTGGKKDAWKEAVRPGSEVAVGIVSIDLEKKRIGVSLEQARSFREKGEARDYAARQEGQQSSAGFGSLGDKLRAAMDPNKDPSSER